MKQNQKHIKQSPKVSRRDFMGGAVSTIAAFTIVPRHVLGGSGYVPPSEKLNIAGIGAGGMGARNIKNCSGETVDRWFNTDPEIRRLESKCDN